MSKDLEPRIEAYNETGTDSSVVMENPKKTWRSYIWDSLDKSSVERKFLFKLDTGLLTIGCSMGTP